MDVHPPKNGIYRYWSIPIPIWRHSEVVIKHLRNFGSRFTTRGQFPERPVGPAAIFTIHGLVHGFVHGYSTIEIPELWIHHDYQQTLDPFGKVPLEIQHITTCTYSILQSTRASSWFFATEIKLKYIEILTVIHLKKRPEKVREVDFLHHRFFYWLHMGSIFDF